MKFSLLSFLIVVTCLLVALPVLAQDNAGCRWIGSPKSDVGACQRILGSDEQKWAPSNTCDRNQATAFDQSCCCPVQASKKYLIIGITAAVLGAATILSFLLKTSNPQD